MLSADADSEKITFIKVNVTGTGGVVNSATLKVTVANVDRAESPTGGRIQLSSCAWAENTVTYNNRPPLIGVPGPSQGPVTQNQMVMFDVTSHIPGDGMYCFAITSAPDDGVDYDARESPTLVRRPQLIVN